MEIVEYPVWQIALKNITEATNAEGHGLLFTHEQLKSWMGIEEPKTIDEVKRTGFDYLQGLDRLKRELLLEHQIWLDNDRGHGYRVSTPNDQVKQAPNKYLRRARAELSKAAEALNNVKTELLTMENEQLRVNNMARVVFIKAAMNKRKLPGVKEKKQITDGEKKEQAG